MRLSFILALLSCLPVSLCITTVGDLAVLGGRSVTIPCHYEPQYAGYVKYWCRGRMREICTSLARTDTPRSSASEEQVAIFDDPVQLVFTVTMRELKEDDSGWYWCGVEVGGIWSADVAASLHVDVVHGMSVVNSRLSGEEGTSVTVECQYSEKYRDSEKKWCRSGDWSSCLVTDAESGIYEDKLVVISDDKKGSFSVTLKNLQKRDSGWYWCAAAQQQMSVHIMVTPRVTTSMSWRAMESSSTAAVSVKTSPTSQPQSTSQYTYVPPPKPIAKDWDYQRHFMESPLMVCAVIVILVALVMLSYKLWNHYRKTQRQRRAMEIKARLSEHPGDGDWQNASVVFLNSGSHQVF
ncbi:polymeric immunoglobulin receptor isoform X1 [Osmerus eperlanus]|uniref:polymeric immunoglobulin receptor isoform X1 n=1 Tax=Osmerus eperlanus TaxID=29151 RepID=UPI002E11AB45